MIGRQRQPLRERRAIEQTVYEVLRDGRLMTAAAIGAEAGLSTAAVELALRDLEPDGYVRPESRPDGSTLWRALTL